jgi:hypothetical protein
VSEFVGSHGEQVSPPPTAHCPLLVLVKMGVATYPLPWAVRVSQDPACKKILKIISILGKIKVIIKKRSTIN